MEELYFGRGSYEQFDEYVDFINYVFGFNGNSDDFPKLLPKLYRRELNPAHHSFIATEDGKLKAVIGAFPSEVTVCGTTLRCVGIGNVAVHPYARSRGYMRKLMEMSIDDMIAQGVDFSALGGRRQRYNYFSYERGGLNYSFSINRDNIRHCFGGAQPPFTVCEVGAGDGEALDRIEALSAAQPLVPVRERTELYAILRSWQARPYIVYDGERFVGYCICKGESVSEILAVRDEDFVGMVHSIYAALNLSRLGLHIPPYLPAYTKALEPIAESVTIECSKMFSVLCYRRVIDAFLRLKATYTALPDGELVVLIHGRARDEQLRIAVTGGEISVSETTAPPAIELGHLEAMNYFFAPVCMARETAPDYVKLWLPLPLWLYSADTV